MAQKALEPRFAVDEDNTALFIEADTSGIDLVCIAFGAVRLVRFHHEDKHFLYVTDAIKWYEKEARTAIDEEKTRLEYNLKKLKRAQSMFEKGKMEPRLPLIPLKDLFSKK